MFFPLQPRPFSILLYVYALLIPSFWSSLYHFRQTLCPSLVNVNSRFHFMSYLNGEELKEELKSCYLAPFLFNYCIISLNKVILLAFLFVLFLFIFISWRLITLQYCSGFCHTLT